MSFRGIDIRQSGDRLVFRASLKDSGGAKLTSGTTTLALYELQSDGTLKSFDWSSFTFKTTALTTATRAMTHRTGNNSTVNTGIWTATLLSTEGTNTGLNGFTRGNVYFAQVNNSGATPTDQEREFQYGHGEGDAKVDTDGRTYADSFQKFANSSGTLTVKNDDGTTNRTIAITGTTGADPVTSVG